MYSFANQMYLCCQEGDRLGSRRNEDLRMSWLAVLLHLAAEQLVFIDETLFDASIIQLASLCLCTQRLWGKQLGIEREDIPRRVFQLTQFVVLYRALKRVRLQ